MLVLTKRISEYLTVKKGREQFGSLRAGSGVKRGE